MEILTQKELRGLSRNQIPMPRKVRQPPPALPLRIRRGDVFEVAEKVLGVPRERMSFGYALEVFLHRQKAVCLEKGFRYRQYRTLWTQIVIVD